MSTRDCIATISAAVGRRLSNEEIMDIAGEVEARITRRVNAGDSRFAAAERVGRELAGEELLAAIIERRSAAINARIKADLDRLGTPGREADAARGLLAGVHRGFEGAGRSIDAERHGLLAQLQGGLIHDLRKDGLLQAVRRRDAAFEHDIAVELWAVRDPTSARPTGNAAAVSAARIIDKYLETVRGWQNDAGAWIGKLDNYIVRQSHDMMKVRGNGQNAAYQAWRDWIEPRLDPRTFDGRPDRDKFLRDVWLNLSSGLHDASRDVALAGFSGPGSLAKRLSQERDLHFKSPDAWWEYNQRFGKGGVLDAVNAALETGTRDVALMRRLGTNPTAMFDAWVDRMAKAARDRGDVATADRLAKNGWNQATLRVLTGEADIPGNARLAQVGSIVRAAEAMAKLGGVVLSSIPDLAVNAAMLRRNGIGLYDAYAMQMMELLPHQGEARRATADAIGVGIDHLIGDIVGRLGGDGGLSGRVGAASRRFYQLTGLTWWTDSLKRASGLMLSHNLAAHAGSDFGGLAPRMRRTLERYGIDADRWEIVRQNVRHGEDGRDYVLPSEITDRDTASRLQTYIIDQVRIGMTEPTAFDRAVATLRTQRGTPEGELVRTLGQFKQYAVTYLDRTVGRELFQDGLDVGGLAHLIVATTALGYLAMTLKDVAKGREPRAPKDAAGYRDAIMAAMVQGGGLGIYGDFLFGEANRMGGGLLATLGGPAAGDMEAWHRVWMDLVHGEGKPIADAIQAGKSMTPFVNLFYSRLVLDHLILFRMQEWANPGYLGRYERRVKRENNQTFWLPPSTFAH